MALATPAELESVEAPDLEAITVPDDGPVWLPPPQRRRQPAKPPKVVAPPPPPPAPPEPVVHPSLVTSWAPPPVPAPTTPAADYSPSPADAEALAFGWSTAWSWKTAADWDPDDPEHDHDRTDPLGLNKRGAHKVTQANKALMLRLLGEGATVKAACDLIGVHVGTYHAWRQRDSDFGAQCDVVRVGSRPAARVGTGTFVGFRKTYFGFDTYWHQARMIDVIENAAPMSITMILVPPEHGKTSVLEDWVCHKLADDPNFRITVVSEGQPHAKKFIGRVQKRMVDAAIAPEYIARFGPFYVDGQERKGKPWTTEYMTVYRSSHDERDYSLESRGSTSAIAGTRTDLLVVDDMQSRRNLNQTKKLVDTFRQDFLTRPGTNGRTIIIGTRVDVGDFYETLLDEGVIDNLVCLPATEIIDGIPTPAPCPLGPACDVPEIPHEKPLCPELWPTHALAKKRKQVSDPVWWRNYQQAPRMAGDATFSAAMIDGVKDPGLVVQMPEEVIPVALSLDPALGGGNALVAGALTLDRLEVIDCIVDMGLGRVEQQLQRVEEFVVAYRPSLLIVETDTLQKGLARDDRLRELSSQHGFQVIEHLTRQQKADPILGVSMMAGAFSRKEIALPDGDEYARRRMEPLIKELSLWRPDIATKHLRQDLVMALWFMWKYWMETRPARLNDGNTWRRPGAPGGGMPRSLGLSGVGAFTRPPKMTSLTGRSRRRAS